jgi:hypothetical protein
MKDVFSLQLSPRAICCLRATGWRSRAISLPVHRSQSLLHGIVYTRNFFLNTSTILHFSDSTYGTNNDNVLILSAMSWVVNIMYFVLLYLELLGCED